MKNVIKSTDILKNELKKYASPSDKISRMEGNGEIIRIINGLYETNKNTQPYLLAGSIYGPSYISFDYALSYYGMIPEKVHLITCATFEKKKKKYYETPFGNYSYRDIPSKVFYKGVRLEFEDEYSFKIATPEKALCDKLYTLKPTHTYKEMEELLFRDLRIDEDLFLGLSVDDLDQYSLEYASTNVRRLAKYRRTNFEYSIRTNDK